MGFLMNSYAQIPLKGSVLSNDNNEPLIGATIKIKSKNLSSITDQYGQFTIQANLNDTLLISYIGYQSKQINPPLNRFFEIKLVQNNSDLEEVTVSTGYQIIPKERSTGSFVQINNDLLNRSVSTNIIDRLKEIVSGLSFNNVGASQISIRGQSTIFGNAEPLIVIDNFPFDGNLLDINPNDVQSISILKDAAAASIWGARAGNGVIVITTKKGEHDHPIQISVNSNLTVGAAPDLYARSRLSSSDYIDIEKRLFSNGYYDAAINTGYKPLTPVVELLLAKRLDPANGTVIDGQIEALKQQDVRRDFDRYFYHSSIYQQYALSLKGGGKNNTYFLSTGYDKNKENLVNNGYQRFTLTSGNTFSLLADKLEINTGIALIYNTTQNNNPGVNGITSGIGNSIYPYAQLASSSGEPLGITKTVNNAFINAAKQKGLLDWAYFPLQEIYENDNTNKRANIRLNGGVKYKIFVGFNASVSYQYTDIKSIGRDYNNQNTYFARDLINRYTQINGSIVTRPIPLGGILDNSTQSAINHTGRGQLDFRKLINSKHEINAIAGFEIRDARIENQNFRYYGYNLDFAKNGIVNYTDNNLPYYYDPSSKGSIPYVDGTKLFNDRYLSYYSNVAYTYDNRFTASASARLDQSNLFGVKTNQKGVPLWSGGLSWIISKESSYNIDFLPYLKLRATYGYNGSVNKSVSALTTATLTGLNLFQLPYATIINPPNPELRWERVKILNTGMDFSTKGNKVSGSIEYYYKQGIDLIGDAPFPPSSGISTFRGNAANTVGHGIDVTLSTNNLNGALKWRTDIAFSFLKETVKSYKVQLKANQYIQSPFALPLVGKPLYSIYSYEWANLDQHNGDPQGFVNGNISKDYAGIFTNTTLENMVFNGSRRPGIFGSLRNTFDYKKISLSFNIGYRFRYVFRKSGISYSNDFGLSSNTGEYSFRWQSTGDEQNTIIPSIPTSANNNRDIYFNNSNVLVDRADNIRLQDVRLSYSFNPKINSTMPFKFAQLYLYIANPGLIWKATKFDVDPDNQFGNVPLSISAGFKIDFK
jgi:TonB-linked SusC/RagA family outer membrane protein